VTRIHGRERAAHVLVVQVGNIRVPHSVMQWRDAAVAVVAAMEAGNYAESPAVATPPRMEIVAWPDRKPAEAAPSAEANSKTKAAPPAKK
jgi:hypothetical protein